MIRLPPILLTAAALSLAACQSAEVTRLCTATGGPEVGLSAYATDATGRMVWLASDAEGTALRMLSLPEPIVEALWQDADHTFRATVRGEISPCDGAIETLVTVSFADETTERRDTRCAGNALARLAARIAETSAAPFTQEDVAPRRAPETPASTAEACVWAYEQL